MTGYDLLRQNQLADIDYQLILAQRVFDTSQVWYDQGNCAAGMLAEPERVPP